MQLDILAGTGLGSDRKSRELKPGAWLLVDFLDQADQQDLLEMARAWTDGGWFVPKMPNGTPMNHPICGLGWNWHPYEYIATEREFPLRLYFLAKRAVRAAFGDDAYSDFVPDTAICNWYPPGSSLALHQDRSEDRELIEAGSPIVTVSLGDIGVCRQGNCRDRNGPFDDFEMHSGDVWVMAGPSRQAFHAMLRVQKGSSPLQMKQPGRLSITIRQAKVKAIAPVEPGPAPVVPETASAAPGLGPDGPDDDQDAPGQCPGNDLGTEPATLENLVVGDRVISNTRFKGQVGTVVDLVDRPNCNRVVMVQYPIGPAYPHFLEYLRKVL